MITDRLQYFLEHFWIDNKSTKSGPSDPVFITKILQKYKRNYGNILDNIIFVNLGTKKAKTIATLERPMYSFCLGKFEYLLFFTIIYEDEHRE